MLKRRDAACCVSTFFYFHSTSTHGLTRVLIHLNKGLQPLVKFAFHFKFFYICILQRYVNAKCSLKRISDVPHFESVAHLPKATSPLVICKVQGKKTGLATLESSETKKATILQWASASTTQKLADSLQ